MTDSKKNPSEPVPLMSRRVLLGSIGASAIAAADLVSNKALGANTARHWDRTVDVVCVGSGAAACSAAIAAIDHGSSVAVFEKMPVAGGTTSKSGGAVWIPNNRFLRAAGLKDERADALRYMARCSYPRFYNDSTATLGIPELQYQLLEAFYDNGSTAIDRLIELNAVHFRLFTMYFLEKMAPDYADHLPENRTPRGRCLEPFTPAATAEPTKKDTGFNASTALGPGALLIQQMTAWLKDHAVSINTEHRVTQLIVQNGAVVGVEVAVDDKTINVRAKRGVIFGSGGFAHNYEYVRRYQPGLAGACAKTSSTGDFIAIGTEAGALMGALNTAWMLEVVLEEALETPAVGMGVFLVPGDSMILVNKYGRRVVNEKRSYNDRSKIHFEFDPTKEEYPNQYLFIVGDERTLDAFAGSFPYPVDRREVSYLIQGSNWEELVTNVRKRLESLRPRIGDIELSEDFSQSLAATVKRFNEFARLGRDTDFGRGDQNYDKDFHQVSSTPRAGSKFKANAMPNVTMHPFAPTGPYFAIMVAAGALDTNCGPMINGRAEVLGWDAKPIPGLYGAGNCIAGPAGAGYWGGGGTIGPALTFGYIAGKNAAVRIPA
jgi:succinate dehydrogenase/fumarate reductase flavoprotein subunit